MIKRLTEKQAKKLNLPKNKKGYFLSKSLPAVKVVNSDTGEDVKLLSLREAFAL